MSKHKPKSNYVPKFSQQNLLGHSPDAPMIYGNRIKDKTNGETYRQMKDFFNEFKALGKTKQDWDKDICNNHRAFNNLWRLMLGCYVHDYHPDYGSPPPKEFRDRGKVLSVSEALSRIPPRAS